MGVGGGGILDQYWVADEDNKSYRKDIILFAVLDSQTSPEPQNTTSAEPYILTSSSPAEAISIGLNSTALPSTPPHPKLSPRTLSSERPCHPKIHQDLETGWELLCEASCGPGVTVRWTLAPGDLAAYHKEEAGAQARLSIRPPGPIPEGWFQCRLDPGGQLTSLYVPGQVTPNPCECWGPGGRDKWD